MFLIGSIDFLRKDDRDRLLRQALLFDEDDFESFVNFEEWEDWMYDFCRDVRDEDDDLTEAEIERINAVLREAFEEAHNDRKERR